MRRFILSGGLGVGKTTLINHLEGSLLTVPEPARELIAEHRHATGEPSLDGRPDLFLRRLIDRAILKYESVEGDGVALYDRGLPDCVAYALASDRDSTDAMIAAERYRYENTVFVAAPWQDIYRTDDMRRATFRQAQDFYQFVVTAYEDLGYRLVELPRASVEDRAAFLLAHLNS